MIDLTLNFSSTYALGTYRVCWHVVGSPSPYVCTPVVCTPAISSCTVVVATGITPVGCDVVKFEGYLQPTCEPEESETARAAFEVEYNPCP
jgi:hypothetical protein